MRHSRGLGNLSDSPHWHLTTHDQLTSSTASTKSSLALGADTSQLPASPAGAGAAHRSSHLHHTSSSSAESRQRDAIWYISHLLASGVCSVRSGHAHAADAMHNITATTSCLPSDRLTLDTPPLNGSTSRNPQRQSILARSHRYRRRSFHAALRDTAHLSLLPRRLNTRRGEPRC